MKRKTKKTTAIQNIAEMILENDSWDTRWNPETIQNEYMKLFHSNLLKDYPKQAESVYKEHVSNIHNTMYKATELIKEKGHLLLVCKKPSETPVKCRYSNKTLFWKMCNEPPTKEDERLKQEMDENNKDRANSQTDKIQIRNTFFQRLNPFQTNNGNNLNQINK